MSAYDEKIGKLESGTIQERAVALALRYGQIDGGHHKTWVIDQMVRILTGKDYENLVRLYETSFDDPDEYDEWNTGIAP